MGSTQHGGCQCGAIRYEASSPPLAVFVCHCTECRKQSSSAYGISVQVPRDAFRVAQGELVMWSRPTASGHVLDCWFCPTCGSRLWHQRRGAYPTLNIKGGSLDAPIDLADAIHIWTVSKLRGVAVPKAAKQFPREPD